MIEAGNTGNSAIMSFASQLDCSGDERLNFDRRSSRFYIDDILASDFGQICRSVTAAVSVEKCGLQDATHNDTRNTSNNGSGNEIVSSNGGKLRPSTTVMTPSLPPSCSVTSSRRFRENFAPVNRIKNRNQKARTTIIKVEACCSDSDAVICDSNTRIASDVTSSTTSYPAPTTRHTNPGLQVTEKDGFKLPAWVYCTRYSDRPSSGPRMRRRPADVDSRRRRRSRTSFSSEQLQQLRDEYARCRYVTDDQRRHLADRLGLDINTIKIWFQNRRANDKKASGVRNELAMRLMADGLYNHHTANKPGATASS